MNGITGARTRALILVAAVLGLGACVPRHGGIYAGVVIPAWHRDVLDGEVRWVDLRRGQVGVREYRTEHTRVVWVDHHTPVYAGRHVYSVRALERGDDVRVWVRWDRRGRPWAERIEARWNTRDPDDRHDGSR